MAGVLHQPGLRRITYKEQAMNIQDLQDQVLYIEDMDGITLDGSLTVATHVTLSVTGKDEIISGNHYADFSGLIILNYADIIKALVEPLIPSDEWYSDTTMRLDLTITVDSTDYSFTVNAFSRDALTKISDIDHLDIPLDDIMLPLTVHTLAEEMIISCESATDKEVISVEDCSNIYKSLSSKNVYLPLTDRPFRIRFSTADGQSLVSPSYRHVPGKFERFLFLNRFGALEYFPMAGDLQLTTDYQFEVTRIGTLHNSRVKTSENTFLQHTGPITRKAAKALASMLATGYGYHYLESDADWHRIVITEANLSLKRNDTVHKQSFSFHYAEPLDIHNLTI